MSATAELSKVVLDDVVIDPVGHISISGVHGRNELDDRLAKAARPKRRMTARGTLAPLVVGAVAGAVLMYLFGRPRGNG